MENISTRSTFAEANISLQVDRLNASALFVTARAQAAAIVKNVATLLKKLCNITTLTIYIKNYTINQLLCQKTFYSVPATIKTQSTLTRHVT
jgi:hypothetical protein